MLFLCFSKERIRWNASTKQWHFLSAVASRFPPSNNQLRTSSNLRNQVTIHNGRVTVQQVQGKQNQSYGGHMARQCTHPRRPRNVALFKEKLMFAEAQKAGQIIDEDQLAFLANPTKAILMENLSSCNPKVLSEIPYSDSYPNDMINQDVQETHHSEQTHVDDFEDNEIHSGSNIISLIAKEHAVIDDEETLILEEESRSKMLDKQNDLISIEKKIKISPIDYSKLNKIKEDFGKCFVAQKELFVEQASMLKHSSLSKTPVTSHTHVRIKAPIELPKSVENSNLNAQLQEKVFAITTLKNELGRNVINIVVSKPNATIASGMFIEPISPRLKNDRDAHEVYIEKTIEYSDTLRRFVESAITQYPSKPLLESACMFTKHVQELLVYASQTCLNSTKPSEKLIVVTPINKDKIVRFTELVTSSKNIPKYTDSLKTKDSNKPLLTSTGVKRTTSASGSKPLGNTKNNRITRPLRSNKKNKVEEHPRKVKSSLNKMNSVSEPISNAVVKHSVGNAKFEFICAICNKCLFDANHDICLVDFVNDVNVRSKSKSKRNKKRKAWKPTGKVITPKKLVHLKKTTPKSVETPKPKIKVYSRRPKQIRLVGSSKKAKIVESKIANNSKPTHLWGSNATDVPSSSSLVNDRLSKSSSGTIRFRNNQIAKIIGYDDYQQGNVIISRVYYVEGLRHNLFSVGQFCDANLEVAFQKNTCFIQNLEGIDLLSGPRDTNLYIISLDDMLKTSSIYLLSKASKTKSWLWHRRLSHLSFDTLNKLAKDGLARGIPKLKFQKDHPCSACTLGKSKKFSHQPKAEDTNQEKLYLLHMDLCSLMRVESINGKKYILVIFDDYSRFSWVKFLRSKDEVPDTIIKCIKNIQVRLNATVRNVRTYNGTEFVSQTLRDFYENVGISH
uniref:Integrase catalytic domain-containing protein n=1 Tax=Tanacetum cinerariifolium TaxID=118510 RepID=A0A6L2KZS0_TANCI|nr:hypothetical protein [Tanacetum cinerariifolium]